MSKKFFYDSLDDSRRRLDQTVVALPDGTPVYIAEIWGMNTDQRAKVAPLPVSFNKAFEGLQEVPLLSSHLEVRNIPSLGYVDTQNDAFYLTRIPARQGKQGLCQGNVSIPEPAIVSSRRPGWTNLIGSKAFVNMLTGKYDPFQKIFERVLKSDEPVMKAVSKTLALSIDEMESMVLWNRGIKVAVENSPKRYGPVFNLPSKFAYLKEELSEYGITVS